MLHGPIDSRFIQDSKVARQYCCAFLMEPNRNEDPPRKVRNLRHSRRLEIVNPDKPGTSQNDNEGRQFPVRTSAWEIPKPSARAVGSDCQPARLRLEQGWTAPEFWRSDHPARLNGCPAGC